MKIRFNRMAILPVLCTDCKRFIWMEPYRRASTWNWLAGRYLDKNICNECIKNYDVGGKK